MQEEVIGLKVCKYCGKENYDGSAVCSGCGSVEFRNQCTNCGTVFDTAFCPNCGTKAKDRGLICKRCGRAFFTAFCPNCGWSPAIEREQPSAGPIQTQPQVIIRHEYEAIPVSAEEKRKKAGFWGVRSCALYALYRYFSIHIRQAVSIDRHPNRYCNLERIDRHCIARRTVFFRRRNEKRVPF